MISTPRTSGKRSQAFTLIELLVVIAIIAVLMGILMPAASSAMNSAKKTATKNQVIQIATALTAYETEYGRLPSLTQSNFDNLLVAMLCTTNDTVNNPRGIIFLEAGPWKKGKGGTNASGFFCDPFGNSGVTNSYKIALDTNYANTIQVPSQPNPGGPITNAVISKHVGVWTYWINGKQTNIINSWD